MVGLVIYTGMETKIMMSLPNPPSKRSFVEIVRTPQAPVALHAVAAPVQQACLPRPHVLTDGACVSARDCRS